MASPSVVLSEGVTLIQGKMQARGNVREGDLKLKIPLPSAVSFYLEPNF
jgi:hypothetical protein